MTSSGACITVEVHDHQGLTQLAPEWAGLLPNSYDNRLFLTPTWAQVWWQHFGAGQAAIVTLRDDRLRAVLPLQISTVQGERVLSLLGDPEVTDYMDAVAERDQAVPLLTTLWEYALSHLQADRLALRHVPSGSALLEALREVAARRGSEVVFAEDTVCPIALLCNTWDGYLQMLTKKQRHEIRRKLRRATEGAEWSWRTAQTGADLDRDLPIFFQLHEASARDKARFMTPAMRQYFTALAHTFLERNNLRLSIFQRDGVDLAATMGFLYRDRYLLYNSGYNPAFATVNPGIAAVALSMQSAIEDKAVAFDFLSGDEPYKYQFGATNSYTCRAELTL